MGEPEVGRCARGGLWRGGQADVSGEDADDCASCCGGCRATVACSDSGCRKRSGPWSGRRLVGVVVMPVVVGARRCFWR